MNRKFLLFFWIFALVAAGCAQDVRIAHLTDLHIGLARAPRAADNLKKAVEIINQRGVDAVLVTGDIGETPRAWDEARDILKHCKAPVYYVPGNHDIHSNDFDRYRHVFGDDFYKVQVRYVTIYGFDSEAYGNYDSYDADKVQLQPQSDEAQQNLARMRQWKEEEAEQHQQHVAERAQEGAQPHVVIGMQHIPIARDGNMPPDGRPYWFIPEQDRKRETETLKKLGIHDMLCGHWHHRDVFKYDGITWHVGSATSWLTFGGELGFDIDTIAPNGEFKSEFVSLGK